MLNVKITFPMLPQTDSWQRINKCLIQIGLVGKKQLTSNCIIQEICTFFLKVRQGEKEFLNPVFKLELSFTSLFFFFFLNPDTWIWTDKQPSHLSVWLCQYQNEMNMTPSSREGTHSKGIFYRTILHTALVTGERNLVFLFCWYWISWRIPWASVEMLWNSLLSLLSFCSHEGKRKEVFCFVLFFEHEKFN